MLQLQSCILAPALGKVLVADLFVVQALRSGVRGNRGIPLIPERQAIQEGRANRGKNQQPERVHPKPKRREASQAAEGVAPQVVDKVQVLRDKLHQLMT